MFGVLRKICTFLIVFALFLSMCSTIFCGGVVVAEEVNEYIKATNEYANIVNATAKMRRPLYVGLDSEVRTDSNGNEWNYFDPHNAGGLVEVTLEFSDGRTKSFAINSQLHNDYSNYMLDLNFENIDLNNQENPLEQGKKYNVPFTYICDYYGPYVISIDMMVEVEIAAERVTGLSAKATNSIPTELIDRLDNINGYITNPQVAFTLSNGDEIPIDVNNQEYSYRLYRGEYVYFEEPLKNSIVWGDDGKGKSEITVYFGSERLFETKMPVIVEAYGGIDSVTGIANEPIYEGAQGYYDGNSFSYSIYQMDIDVNVNFKNGKSLAYNISDDDFHKLDLNFECNDAEWEVGKPCTVKIKKYYEDEFGYYGATELGSFNIEMKPNPVESISIRTINALEYEDDGYFSDDGYYHYFLERCRPLYTIKFNDGRPDMVDLTRWEVGNLGFYVNEVEQNEKRLELGENILTASIGDVSCEYKVYVVKNFIKDVRVKKGITIIDGMFGGKNYHYDEETYEEIVYYDYLPQFFDAELEYVLYDGTVITESTIANKGEIDIYAYNRFRWYGDKLNQTADDHWKVGDNFEISIEITTDGDGTFNLQVPVTVKPNETNFELGWYYEDSKYSKGLGIRIEGLKDVSDDLTLVIPEKIYGYPVNSVESLYCFGYVHGMLETVILPDSVKYVSDYAFESMRSLEYLYLGNVEKISHQHFFMASAYDVEFSKTNPYYTAKDGVIYNKDMTEIVAFARNDDVTIVPTVKELKNDFLGYSEYIYGNNTVTILGNDTRLVEIDNSDEYNEKTPFPFIRCRKGSAAENDAKALGVEHTTFMENTPGDINNDYFVNLADLVTLARVVADWEVEHNAAVTDVNGDGVLDTFDLVHLARYNAGWEGIILH